MTSCLASSLLSFEMTPSLSNAHSLCDNQTYFSPSYHRMIGLTLLFSSSLRPLLYASVTVCAEGFLCYLICIGYKARLSSKTRQVEAKLEEFIICGKYLGESI